MKQKTETKPAAADPQVTPEPKTHFACLAASFALLIIIGLQSHYAPKWGREKLLKEQAKAAEQADLTSWLKSKYPGYLGDADFSREVIKPFGVKDLAIEFGLAPDGTVVWRNHDPDRVVEFWWDQRNFKYKQIPVIHGGQLLFEGSGSITIEDDGTRSSVITQ